MVMEKKKRHFPLFSKESVFGEQMIQNGSLSLSIGLCIVFHVPRDGQ